MNEYAFTDIKPGMSESFSREITAEMTESFAELSGDVNPLHTDDGFARSRGYRERVVYGMLTASFVSTLAGMYLPGRDCILMEQEMKFKKPVFIGDVLTVTGTVEEVNDSFMTMDVRVVVMNQRNEKVCRGRYRAGIAREQDD